MSHPVRGPGAFHGAPSGNSGGSVRAARMRAEKGEAFQQHNYLAPPPPSLSTRPPSSKPTQWPLIECEPASAPPRARGPPPQRPPRPRYVPSILDSTNQSDRLPPGQDQASPGDGELHSPYSASQDLNLMTGNSVHSSSALGPIPDFPVPNAPRKPPALGLPPSARRGPSFYYSQNSHVSPIVEETESHRSYNSFASSNVIPANIGDFYFHNGALDDDNDDNDDPGSLTERGDSDDGRSRPSDDGDQSGLVRQASMGKRGKPLLTTIKSTDGMDKPRDWDKSPHDATKVFVPSPATIPVGLAVSKSPSADELRGGTGLIPPSPSINSNGSNSGGKSPLAKEILDDEPDSPIDPRVDKILGGLEKGGLSVLGKKARVSSKLSDRVGTRRPPHLNINALQEAESRGSLTSLPDLIRRATKLASNLERGKTASRLGFDLWELGGPSEEKRAAAAAAARKSDSSSLADMLMSFPRPATASPARSPLHSPNGGAHWPAGLVYEKRYDGAQVSPKPRGRRCCGVPRWAFILLLIIFLLLVAAAAVVPTVLKFVVFKDNDSSQQKPANGCETSVPCSNGGTSMLDPTGSCVCICANGYTGAYCTQAPESACVTTNTGGSSNATIGSAIPELINKSQSSFQIPLNGTQLLSLFSKANLSCSAENALVTFSGLSKTKRGLDRRAQLELLVILDEEEDDVAQPAPAHAPVSISDSNSHHMHHIPAAHPLVTPHARLQRRQYSTDAAKTNLGIVYDANGGSTLYSATSTVTTTPTSAASITSTSTSEISAKRLAFCQTAVLYVYQASSSLDYAVAAQENLQTYFTEYVAGGQAAVSATAVSLGHGWTIDLTGWTVKDAGGIITGSRGANVASTRA